MWDISLRLKYKNIPQVYRCFSVYKYNSVYHIYNKYIYIYLCVCIFCAYIYISIYTRYTYVTPEETQISSPEPWCHNHHQGPSSSIAGSIAGVTPSAPFVSPLTNQPFQPPRRLGVTNCEGVLFPTEAVSSILEVME